MIAWLKLETSCPEYFQATADDMEFLVDWYFEFEEVSQQERDSFQTWLATLPLGVVTPLPNRRHGHIIVKVEYPSG